MHSTLLQLQQEYFSSMGHALIGTVESLLGKEEFTDDIKKCWIEVYGAMSNGMIRARTGAASTTFQTNNDDSLLL